MKEFSIRQVFSIFIVLFLLCSCQSKDKNPKEEKQAKAEEIYNKAMSELEQKHYVTAAETFAKVYNEYPYSELATESMLMEGFSYYKKHDFDMAIPIFEEFIKLHPGYKDIAYLYYLKALSFYKQITDIEHDQEFTEKAKEAIAEFLIRFPNSKYARELKLKLDLINDHLAGKEMEVGRFYLLKGETLAAINRFRNVVEKYQTTSHVQEALYRLVEGYYALGIIEEAKKNAVVLGHNYPNSKWYKYSYKLLSKEEKPLK